MRANDTERVWTVSEHRYVYVEQQPEQAGGTPWSPCTSMTSMRPPAAAAQRGIHWETRETYGNGVPKAIYRDPDGNEIGVGGAPASRQA